MGSGLNNETPGEIDAKGAYALLGSSSRAQLVDVRSKAEWTFVGVPDLAELGKEVLLIEWQRYPEMEVAPEFVDAVTHELSRIGTGPGDPVLFLCRSGVRSLAAARAMAAAGWRDCRNILGGFEGPLDPSKHRGSVSGWKVSGLPWIQT